ncbi:MAG: hypothetical protein IJN37_04460 [Clostridia bacterium]|nr:hypothetical protein [Clostridia bacterium]
MSKKSFAVITVAVMMLSLFMPTRLEGEDSSVITLMSYGMGMDPEGVTRMSGKVFIDETARNFEMHGRLDGAMENYSGALMGNVNGEPAAMYVFYSGNVEYAALAIGAANEDTKSKIYTYGECTDEMYNDIVKRQVRETKQTFKAMMDYSYNEHGEYPENPSYRETYSAGGMKMEKFAPLSIRRGRYDMTTAFYLDEAEFGKYADKLGIDFVENSLKASYISVEMESEQSDGVRILRDIYPPVIHGTTEDPVDSWYGFINRGEYGNFYEHDGLKHVRWEITDKTDELSDHLKSGGAAFRAGFDCIKEQEGETEIKIDSKMLVSFLGEDGPYAFLLQSSDNANCTIELVTE